jgi:hypothetical protein
MILKEHPETRENKVYKLMRKLQHKKMLEKIK